MTGLHFALGVALFFLILLYLTLQEINKTLKRISNNTEALHEVYRRLEEISGRPGEDGMIHTLNDSLWAVHDQLNCIENKMDLYLDENWKRKEAARWERPF